MLDSAIAPEQAKSWEVGAKLDMPGRIMGTLALYDIKNATYWCLPPWATSHGVFLAAGEVSSRGLELDVSGQLSEQWSLIAGYAYTDAQVTKDPIYKACACKTWRKTVARCRRYVTLAWSWAAINCAWGGCPVCGRAPGMRSMTSTCPVTPWPMPSPLTTPGVGAGQKVTLQLNLKNLFDRTYYTSAASRTFVPMGILGKSRWPARWSFEASGA